MLSKVAHLLLGKTDVRNIACGELGITVVNLLLAETEVLSVELVELNRQLAYRGVSARFNVRQNFFHRFTNGTIVRFYRFRFSPAFDPGRHNLPHYDVNKMLMHSNSFVSWRE